MTTYLRNGWYAAAFSDEVSREPISRTLLDTPTVLFRKVNGEPVALFDRCPHRFAPLSLGSLIGDEIQCNYHGLRFDCSGKCSHNPHSKGSAPSAAKVEAYHVIEKFGVIWYWPGDPEKADENLLPDFSYLEQPEEYKILKGVLHVKGNYQLVVDNLLDLTHAPYLHPHFAMPGVTPEQQLAATETRLERYDDHVRAFRLRKGLPPNQATMDLFGFPPDPVDTRTHINWYPPSLIHIDIGSCTPGSDEKKGLCMPQAHCITPETETTCHYFFLAARNMLLNDESVDKRLWSILEEAFQHQDEPMIEAVQERMGDTGDLNSLNPVFLSSDGPPVAARRLLEAKIAEEAKAL